MEPRVSELDSQTLREQEGFPVWLMALQRRAYPTVRMHFLWGMRRLMLRVVGDLLVVLLLAAFLVAIRDGALFGSQVAALTSRLIPQGTLGGFWFPVAMSMGLLLAGSYSRGDPWRAHRRVLAGAMIAAALTLWPSVQSGITGAVIARFLLISLGVGGALMAAREIIRWVWWHTAPELRSGGRLLVVGRPGTRDAVETTRRLVRWGQMEVIGWVHGGDPSTHDDFLGSPKDFWRLLAENPAETVVVCEPLADPDFATILEATTISGGQLLATPRIRVLPEVRRGVVWVGDFPFASYTQPSTHATKLLVKRLTDVIASALGLVILLAFLPFLWLAVRLDSRGSLFFRQERVGHGGRTFWMLKIRTMQEDADSRKGEFAHLNHHEDPRLFKIPDDPRVTRVGAWLRSWSLDELPQLWNVFRGDMSLVGPRPFFDADLDHYEPRHFGRFGMRPGITGLWQVTRRSDVEDFEEVAYLDRIYIDHWSLWLDTKILLRTLPAVLRRHGAY
jgi:exopolysaccharide biosynthesis polyprenyl glycosylphosphotransferase